MDVLISLQLETSQAQKLFVLARVILPFADLKWQQEKQAGGGRRRERWCYIDQRLGTKLHLINTVDRFKLII